MKDKENSFGRFILNGNNKWFLISGLLIGIVYFIALRILYPVPSYYSDSFTWVGAARTGQPVTFRPIGYSKFLMLLHYISHSDFLVIAVQYFANLLTNLFLFFTVQWFFPLRRLLKLLLFFLLVLNPFYVAYSNYISSDAAFTCLTVLWFTLLIWIIHNPSRLIIALQVLVLGAAFEIRYNAVFFPFIAAVAFFFSKAPVVRKLTGIGATALCILSLYLLTTYQTEKFTGTKIFSAFSGWQLANDALHVIQHDKVDSNKIKDKEIKRFLSYTVHFFDTTKQRYPDTAASAFFMWYFTSPLKRYMEVYGGKNDPYFKTWNRLGPIYGKFGTTVILQKPFTYFKHFILPNSGAYFFPPLEIYETYMENRRVIPPVVTKYFKYKQDKTPKHYPKVYNVVFKPMQYLFAGLNLLLPFLPAYYLFSKKYKTGSINYNHTLIVYGLLIIANFLFIVLLAPSVFRYHIYILTLSFPLVLYLIQILTDRKPEIQASYP